MRILTIPAILVLTLMGAMPMLPEATDPTTIYLSPTGSDTESGLTPATAIKTLERAEQVINDLQLDTDVEIRIKQGLYVGGRTNWNTFIPGHTISFMPIDYQYGMSVTEFAGRPVFRGNGTGDWWLVALLPTNHPGGDTGLRFYYLQVDYYQNGLMIHGRYTTNANGVRVPSTLGANGNTVYGMNFFKLGSKYGGLVPFGVAAVDLVNSSDNLIRNNHFTELENTARADWSHLHAVYLAHGSSHNEIINNKMKTVSGSGIDIRNGSNFTDITGNTFDHVGINASLQDWFCDGQCVIDGNPQECASVGTEFHGNILGVGYNGLTIPSVGFTPPGNTYYGPATCSGPYTGVRVTEWDNT